MTRPEGVLSIGDLAERTGVGVATIRVWESRHGFPVPHRLESGHRRYDEHHVALVRDVVRRRDAGIRLDVAIEQALAAGGAPADPPDSAPGAPSIYARLRHTHPELVPQRLTKATLLALSWAIEDEFASRAQRAHLFGAFQHASHFASAQARWSDLSRTMATTFVLADFDDTGTGTGTDEPWSERIVPVPLPDDHPLRREWAVVCDADHLPVALTAWELPGQTRARDAERIFETVWTVERDAVREAARVCARVVADLGIDPGPEVAAELDGPLGTGSPDLGQVTSLFNRVVAYVDRKAPGR